MPHRHPRLRPPWRARRGWSCSARSAARATRTASGSLGAPTGRWSSSDRCCTGCWRRSTAGVTWPPSPRRRRSGSGAGSGPSTSSRSASISRPFQFLFRPWVLVPALIGFLAVCWFVLIHKGVAAATADAFDRPELLLLVLGLTVASAAFHEIGHAAACRYG